MPRKPARWQPCSYVFSAVLKSSFSPFGVVRERQSNSSHGLLPRLFISFSAVARVRTTEGRVNVGQPVKIQLEARCLPKQGSIKCNQLQQVYGITLPSVLWLKLTTCTYKSPGELLNLLILRMHLRPNTSESLGVALGRQDISKFSQVILCTSWVWKH